MNQNVTVNKVIERDDDRILFGGKDGQGEPVSFHLMRPAADDMAKAVESGELVEVEIPT